MYEIYSQGHILSGAREDIQDWGERSGVAEATKVVGYGERVSPSPRG